jgi:RHH-type transcriptional regulator, rel operon repressor / antitoxin RelB
MHTVTSKIPDDLFVKLENLAELTDRKKSYLIKKSIELFLEEKADYFIALARLESNNPKISLEDLEKDDNELED